MMDIDVFSKSKNIILYFVLDNFNQKSKHTQIYNLLNSYVVNG